MLTRLEVDGFKNLLGFSLDLGPLTCIAGPNSVGKSNIFDAIQFVSFLADHTIMEAALRIRGGNPESSDVRDLFWTSGSHTRDTFKIAVEMIVPERVKDDFGRPTEATSTFLRYEVEIGYAPPSSDNGLIGRLILRSESLNHITQGDSFKHLRFPHSAKEFRSRIIVNRRKSQAGFISTRQGADNTTEIVVHQDGGSRGPGQTAPAESAPRTIVGTSNTSATPTILAARREMQSWRLLALEPTAMRRPDRFQDEQVITMSGGHLPGTLQRLAGKRAGEDQDGEEVFAEVTSRLAELVPVLAINLDRDTERRLLTLKVKEESGIELSASSLSDGTLRFLALSIMASDPQATGLLCMEEPENGIHPAKMEAMVELLHDLAVDPHSSPGEDNPLRQVMVATHSPAFVQLQDPEDLVFAVESKLRGESGQPLETIRCEPLQDTWRAELGGRGVGFATILTYLTAPPKGQVKLPLLAQEMS